MPELDPGVAGGESPVDLALVGVGGLGPRGEFGVQDIKVTDAPAKALAGQGGQFDLAYSPGFEPLFSSGLSRCSWVE